MLPARPALLVTLVTLVLVVPLVLLLPLGLR
jgi:hypothetical protein